MGNNSKSVGLGLYAIINGIKTGLSIVFPLITYPYITRVLGVEQVGAYGFSYSVINYFYLISALGINTYAIREGAKYKNDRIMLSEFASEVFTINLVSTVVSYCLLFVSISAVPFLHPYKALLMVLSISMVFTTLGCEWVYNIHEQFLYVAVRTLLFQLLSLGLLFSFVKTENDLVKYAYVVVISASGANFVNFIKLKKYITLQVRFRKKIFVHLSPIIILFANTLATTVYVNSDLTLLGILTNDYCVGIYTIASKVYSIIKQIIAAIIIVSIPRLSALRGKLQINEYNKLASKVLNALMVVLIPSIIGLIMLRKEAVLVISTEAFLGANKPLAILSVALFLSVFSWFFTSCVLIPCKRERVVLSATIVAALVNVVLNILLIPSFRESAAALTTLIAEGCSAFICMMYSRECVKLIVKKRDVISVVIGCCYIVVVCFAIQQLCTVVVITVIASFLLSVIGYFLILILLKHSLIIEYTSRIKKIVKL